VEIEEWIDLDGKVKFPRGVVVHTGCKKSATDYIISSGAKGAIIGGTATAGDGGTATAGDGGIIQIKFWENGQYRIKTGYIGENGLRRNVKYKLDSKEKFIEA
jgi:hypothetical protein